MRRPSILRLICAIGLLFGGVAAFATTTVVVEEARAAEAPRAGMDSVVSLTLANRGDQTVRLIAVRTEAAERVELRSPKVSGYEVNIEPVDAIEIRAGETKELGADGPHLLLRELREPLLREEAFSLTLVFENADELAVSAKVQ